MPELPEVETVKRELSSFVINKTFDKPTIYYHHFIKTNEDEFLSQIEGKTILSLSRKGKFLVFHLSGNKKMIFHLRMEGKMFKEDNKKHSLKYLTAYFPFKDVDYGFAFYDVRKFGCLYYLDENDNGPLANVGKEPFEINDSSELYKLYHTKKKPIKELLMDQSLMSGIGNIYADEILFRSRISPFKKGCELNDKDFANILNFSVEVLKSSIESNGSTVKTYKASEHIQGSFQDQLLAYGKEGQICPYCHEFRIEKRKLGGRGTCYCPKCQNTGLNIGITGKIASGKSTVSHYFEGEGFVRFSADEVVHNLYTNKAFLKTLRSKFPIVFNEELSKAKIADLLTTDKAFRKSYTSFIFNEVKNQMNEFIINNDGKDKVLEIPLLFDAHMENDFTYIIGVETIHQKKHLLERGDDLSRVNFNALNSYDQNHDKLDFIIHTDGTLGELKTNVKRLIKFIKK